jgi:bacillithiol biosynthesis deacetylase BshB1
MFKFITEVSYQFLIFLIMNLDVIVFAAHPDDAELSMGGTIIKLTRNNKKVGIIDFTKGELGTRGTPETRRKEAFDASAILKVAVRENLEIADGNIVDNKENLMKVVLAIRQYKPKIIFAPYFNDRHPDHIDTSKIVKRAMFTSGLAKVKTYNKKNVQDAYRPAKLFYYMQTYTFEPSFIIDISESFEDKMKAVKAYESQFHNPENSEKETFISRPEFLRYVESRAYFYGFQIGKKYGEPFYCEEKIELDINYFLKK